jgi:disulfide bond formation protein DsbB
VRITLKQAVLFCGLISFTLLASAFWFEYFVGLYPCKLCIWQRWPHAAILVLALAGFTIFRSRWVLLLIAVSAMITGIIGLYHAGVEQGLWQGPSGCTNQLNSTADISSLTEALLAMPVVKCDEIVWSLIGISMAGWNSIASFGLAVLALAFWQKLK